MGIAVIRPRGRNVPLSRSWIGIMIGSIPRRARRGNDFFSREEMHERSEERRGREARARGERLSLSFNSERNEGKGERREERGERREERGERSHFPSTAKESNQRSAA